MYLWVWEDVLTDYTPGIMFALAPTAEKTRELIRLRNKQTREVGPILLGLELDKEPKQYDLFLGGAAYIIPGGG